MSRRRSWHVFGLMVAIVLLVSALPAAASPTAGTSSSGVVISQVYGGGGNTGATYTNDFIELHNQSAAAVDLTG